jgi:hypothetical protein
VRPFGELVDEAVAADMSGWSFRWLDGPLPFAAASFDLVCSRHPVSPDWGEIARVLTNDGTYFAQHVGRRRRSS